jgi:hypothetical protein
MLGVTSVALAESFTSIDFIGATRAKAFGINPRGDIVGNYSSAPGKGHGYLPSRQQ